MILRRLTDHIREQNWTAVAMDFVIVVLGVYVGLQVNLWNEARVYVRYVTFVEDELLPGLGRGKDVFYDADGHLQPRYRANMDRLVDYQLENQRMTAWAKCLVYRLESRRTFKETCRRSGFRLDGMVDRPANTEAIPRF
jgi:hypothetical protein